MNEDAHPLKAIRDAIAGFVLTLAMLPGSVIAASTQGGSEADIVVATRVGDSFSLTNHAIGAKWSVTDGRVNSFVVTDRMHGTELRVSVPFGRQPAQPLRIEPADDHTRRRLNRWRGRASPRTDRASLSESHT